MPALRPLIQYHHRVADYLRQHPRASTLEMAAALRLTPATVRQAMTDLRGAGYRIRCERCHTIIKEPE